MSILMGTCTIYCVMIRTPQGEQLVGALYGNPNDANIEVSRLLRANGAVGLEAWVETRQVEIKV
jgi:hypothetical protein